MGTLAGKPMFRKQKVNNEINRKMVFFMNG